MRVLLFVLICIGPFLPLFAIAYEQECYPDLGCFTNAPPWGNTAERPIDTLPDSPADVNTQFLLDTRRQGSLEIYYNDMAGVSSSTIDTTKMTRLIVHGYVDDGDSKWMKQMSDTLLASSDQNVIRVSWTGASMNINYDKSAVNAEVAGAATGLLVKNMINDLGMDPSMFHCIGHSLGAHICAYVGNNVPGLGRISGLDPAGTYFEGTQAVVRLDTSDALFVDVIHTDADEKKGYGTSQQSGHVDFWPNGGVIQPGCDQNIVVGIIGTIVPGDFVECNHMSAVEYFTESILINCPFSSYPCDSYNNFLLGNCITCGSTSCPRQGYYADQSEGFVSGDQTYLMTADSSPYCEYMTYVSITISSETKTIDAYLYVTLVGTMGTTEQQQLGGNGQEYELRSGNSYKALTYYASDPGDVTSVILEWKQKEIELGRQTIGASEISIWKGDTQKQFTFCGGSSADMKEKEPYVFSTVC